MKPLVHLLPLLLVGFLALCLARDPSKDPHCWDCKVAAEEGT